MSVSWYLVVTVTVTELHVFGCGVSEMLHCVESFIDRSMWPGVFGTNPSTYISNFSIISRSV